MVSFWNALCPRFTFFEPSNKVFKDALAIALAAGLDGVLSADHHHVVAGGSAGGKAMGLVAAVREILKRSVEGKAIEGLQFFDR